VTTFVTAAVPDPPDGAPGWQDDVDVLLHDSRAMDRDAEFSLFASAARAELERTAWYLTGDRHLAAELVQESLVRTYVAWPRARRSNPTAYARRVLANARIDLWRRRRREVLVAPDDVPDLPHDGAGLVVEQRDELVRALALLTVRQRRVVVLRYLMGLSEREVAADLGVTVGTVKTQASRGLRTLRSSLGDLGTAPQPPDGPGPHDTTTEDAR